MDPRAFPWRSRDAFAKPAYLRVKLTPWLPAANSNKPGLDSIATLCAPAIRDTLANLGRPDAVGLDSIRGRATGDILKRLIDPYIAPPLRIPARSMRLCVRCNDEITDDLWKIAGDAKSSMRASFKAGHVQQSAAGDGHLLQRHLARAPGSHRPLAAQIRHSFPAW